MCWSLLNSSYEEPQFGFYPKQKAMFSSTMTTAFLVYCPVPLQTDASYILYYICLLQENLPNTILDHIGKQKSFYFIF